MSKRRLVLAHDDGQMTIPFGDVVDVVVGNVPDELEDVFDDTVTIAYGDDERTRAVLIEGRDGTIPKFVSVLFKCLLNGTEGVVTHPARVGGRVLETGHRPARVRVGADRLEFTTPDESFGVDADSVIGLGQTDTTSEASNRRGLAVTYEDDSRVVTSVVSTDSTRRLQLLGRYLGRTYRSRRSDVATLDLDTAALRVLVALYTAGSEVDIADVVGDESLDPRVVVSSLTEKGLVADAPDGPIVTTLGRVAMFERFDETLD